MADMADRCNPFDMARVNLESPSHAKLAVRAPYKRRLTLGAWCLKMAAPPPTSPLPSLPPFDPNPTIGALLVGTLASGILFGINTTQNYVYYRRFPQDPRMIKWLVTIVWVMEFVHIFCISHVLYTYAVVNYGNPLIFLDKIPPTLALTILLGTVNTALVEAFFVFRIWTLAQNNLKFFKLVPLVLCVTITLFVAGTTADTVLSIQAANIPAFNARFDWLLVVPNSLNVFNDGSITISLITLLLLTRKGGFAKTAMMLDQLIKWTLETGLITGIFSCLSLIFCVRQPNDFIWVSLQVVKARLFANSLMASLNSRDNLREMTRSTADWASSGNNSYRPGYSTTAAHGSAVAHNGVNIAMTKVTLGERDGTITEPGGYEYGYKSAEDNRV
ncbi:hypothetical protein MIND_00413100 [Mycena indigotica]|uniref:DUF6534 domain-containing protein n=1 Tax=Mycena indigotica TaxID=2126181 RepID=A0A8H6W7W0_9AGAR|nr:uncharacterized protein MIND_00413100 [Mycena indigotica]KAF7306226.1 hypothetical protein MIND_00413100 [Mycena indigotica]